MASQWGRRVWCSSYAIDATRRRRSGEMGRETYQTVILEQAPEAQEVSMNSQRSIDSELLEEESSETLDDESSFDEPGGETTR